MDKTLDLKPIIIINVKNISIAGWLHYDSEEKPFYVFSVKCSYFDKKEQCYKKSTNFNIDNLKDLSVAINLIIEQYYKRFDKNNKEDFIQEI